MTISATSAHRKISPTPMAMACATLVNAFRNVNGNSTWDADRGASGQGGASDVVVYTVTLSYNRLFPLWKMLGEPQAADIEVTTVLRNQPYMNQNSTSSVICT